jgi:ribosome biogenesis GTPase A
VDELPQRGVQIKALLEETSTERLEAAVSAGVKVLSELEVPLKELPGNTDASAWLEQIGKVRDLAERTRTIVGVVGNTGAGKSSLINAMLDEERFVPTNCMRACTAVLTELSLQSPRWLKEVPRRDRVHSRRRLAA